MKKNNLGLNIGRMQMQPKVEEAKESPYSEGPIEIIDGLYLGSKSSANDFQSLRKLGINAVLNVAKECPMETQSLLKIKFDWTHDEDLSLTIEKAIEMIERCRQQGIPILVHCLQGLSRSAALIIGYVMKSQKMSCTEAYQFVKKRAPQISPNVSLISHLYHLETIWSF